MMFVVPLKGMEYESLFPLNEGKCKLMKGIPSIGKYLKMDTHGMENCVKQVKEVSPS